MKSQEIKLEGHIIDSFLLPKVLDTIMEDGGDFEILEFNIGKHKTDKSYAQIIIKAENEAILQRILTLVHRLGAEIPLTTDVQLVEAPADQIPPVGFYAATNQPTFIRFHDKWLDVRGSEIDTVITVKNGMAHCKKISDIKKEDEIVVGNVGVYIDFPGRMCMELERTYGAHNYRPLPVVISKGEGVWVWDIEGRKYMDMLSSYSALSHGHRHPAVIKAAINQLEKLTLTSRAFFNDKLGAFLKHLCEVTEMETALPMNTGAEAVETAIKVARKYSYEKKGIPKYQAEIVVCENNFHGRTTTIVSFSSDPLSYEGYGPFTPGFVQVPFNDAQTVEDAITENTIGILVEPIQAEAGIFIPDKGYLTKLRHICTEHNILLMLDEIQTGLGRTGRLFAFEHEGIRPDILILGKALGGGVIPVSMVLSSKEIMGVLTPGTHGSTFGGNPLACAIADAALDVILNDNLSENARKMGNYFMKKLRAIKCEKIKEVRGKGLLIGMELYVKQNDTVRPVCEKLLQLGVMAKDTHEKTVRFAPPLVITKPEIDWAVDRIKKSLEG